MMPQSSLSRDRLAHGGSELLRLATSALVGATAATDPATPLHADGDPVSTAITLPLFFAFVILVSRARLCTHV